MAVASIPVELLNPGQVFACLGFLEAADILLGDADGAFDWTDEAQARFVLGTSGVGNPFAAVLAFLAEAEIQRCVPAGYIDPPQKARKKNAAADDDDSDSDSDSQSVTALTYLESFPGRNVDRMALPIRLASGTHRIDIGHWTDGTRRNAFKLYAGNRSAHSIAIAMLRGTREKPRKHQTIGDVKTLGVAGLWDRQRAELIATPFDVLTPMGGSFNFDARGGWTAIDAGYSPNDHQDHWITASPAVEILAAVGLEHSRPHEFQTRNVSYGTWNTPVAPILARVALGSGVTVLGIRKFRFELALSGKNKIVTFAQEERIR